MRRYFTLLLLVGLAILAASCQKQTNLFFYMENNSSDVPVIGLSIYLDDSLVVEDRVEVDTVIAPSFSVHKVGVMEGKYELKVVAKSVGLEEKQQLVISGDRYVFLSFNHRIKKGYEYDYEKSKFEMMYPRDKYHDKVFEFDSVAVAPRLDVQVFDKMPDIH